MYITTCLVLAVQKSGHFMHVIEIIIQMQWISTSEIFTDPKSLPSIKIYQLRYIMEQLMNICDKFLHNNMSASPLMNDWLMHELYNLNIEWNATIISRSNRIRDHLHFVRLVFIRSFYTPSFYKHTNVCFPYAHFPTNFLPLAIFFMFENTWRH